MRRDKKPAVRKRIISPVGDVVEDLVRHDEWRGGLMLETRE
jgi:hypothetical protein